MKIISIYLPFFILFTVVMPVAHAEDTANKQDKGTDYFTKPFWNIDKTYRVKYAITGLTDESGNCATKSTTEPTIYSAGKSSIFREVSAPNDKEMIVSFDYIKNTQGKLPDLSKPYLLCTDRIPEYKYSRVGGIDTGILVVPYKVRKGDLYGDSTLGPYIAFKGNALSLLATFGLTQVTVSDIANNDIKTETGLSYAVGFIWSLNNSFDIGLVAGKDHLSGLAGDDFKYQDEIWWSFAIGYNFTN